MNDLEIENLAEYVLSTYRLKIPVELERICAEEGILLAPGRYSPSFHGRIEFIPDHRVFVIYYPEPLHDHYPGRVRFSLSHELGHYFIEEHRRIIQEQRVHNSIGPFRSVSDRIENEADKFASALLIPAFAVEATTGTKGFLDLPGYLNLQTNVRRAHKQPRFDMFDSHKNLALRWYRDRARYFILSALAKRTKEDLNGSVIVTYRKQAKQENVTFRSHQ